MQRIDENTYIDDTLVTCAEYQLFIDEMREQGKYYQPDHWTSYQFPEGQAREPILGVRSSDVVAFCEWLSVRCNKDWKYRLPRNMEIDEYSLKHSERRPLGYWIAEKKSRQRFSWRRQRFAWVNGDPNNPRSIAIPRTFSFNGERWIDHVLARARELDLDIINEFDLRLDFSPALNRDLRLAHDTSLATAISQINLLLSKLDEDDYNETLSYYVDMYIDIYTLQERIAGRSPAFEGIRLVKERIR